MMILGVFGVKTFIIMSQYGANTSMMVLLKRAGGPKGPQPSASKIINIKFTWPSYSITHALGLNLHLA